jgi:hypothetical protein
MPVSYDEKYGASFALTPIVSSEGSLLNVLLLAVRCVPADIPL